MGVLPPTPQSLPIVDASGARRRSLEWIETKEASTEPCEVNVFEPELAHPPAVSVIESAEALPAAVFRPIEITLTALKRAGFREEEALRAYSLLITFTLGQVAYQIKGWARGVDAMAAASDGRISSRTFPAVVDAAAHKSWDFDRAFEFGLSTVLAGLNAKSR